MTHEIAHSLEVKFLDAGPTCNYRLGNAKATLTTSQRTRNLFRERLAALQRNAPEMDPRRSGLYLRHHLLVAIC
jgi:hypothetical protein